MKNVFLFILLLFINVGCVSQAPAPIELHHDKNFTSPSDIPLVADEEEIVIKPLPKEEKDNKIVGYLKNPKNRENEEDSSTTPTKLEPEKIIYHEVEGGESLEDIALKYFTTTEEIISLNNLTEPYKLQEFQIIKIKVSADTLNKVNKLHAKDLIKNTSDNNKNISLNNSSYVKPVEGILLTRFGENTINGKSTGINIAAKMGSEVKSIEKGTVIHAATDPKFGNLLIIKLIDSDIYAAYAHLNDLIMTNGQVVTKGEIIGHVGKTGKVDKPQLHLAIRQGKTAMDPLKYLPFYNK